MIPHMRVPQLLCDQNRNPETRVDSKGISGSPEYKQLQGCWMGRKTEDIRILETKKSARLQKCANRSARTYSAKIPIQRTIYVPT